MKKLVLFCFLASFFMACSEKAAIEVADLRCENLLNPKGIDIVNPRLSWKLTSDSRGIMQKSYHVLVASSLDKLQQNQGDIWDSNVKSDKSIFIPFEGKQLISRAECYWKVKVTTNKGESEWSAPAYWSMGLLNRPDWSAKWTGLDKSFANDIVDAQSVGGRTRLAARYFRKEFASENKDIAKATLYILGLGLYEAYLNGERVGDYVLAPTPSDYTKTIYYNTLDVSSLISKGNNAMGIILGNGRFFSVRNPGMRHFGFPKMLVQLEIEYTDGSRQVVVSDNSWKVTADGPILTNNEFDGEEYDARKEMQGWAKSGFDETAWMQAELVEAPKTQAPRGQEASDVEIKAQINPNIKVMETIKPVSIVEIKPGMYIMDMGQNMVGWIRMSIKGKRGYEVQLRFAELLKDDGTLYMDNLRSALVTDKYIAKSDNVETWEPSFVYHGFRFVEITGFPGVPTLSNFEGKVVYDEMETVGTFETSNKTINQLYKNAYWGIRGNYRGMPTDCPQRDERLGWLGDRAVGSHGESFIFNHYNLYSKWLDDIEDSQRRNGSVPNVAPNYWMIYDDNMTWPGAYVIMANMLYDQYGSTEPIAKHYESMKKWINYIRDTYVAKNDNIMPRDTYGDWCMPPERPELIHSEDPSRKTDASVLGTTFYYRVLTLLERFANILNKPEDAASFAEQAAVIKEAFNNKFFNKETGQYSNNTVTANLLPLSYGMVADEYKEKVFNNIVDKTMGDFNGHVSTGLVGIQWLMRGLSDYGRPDIAFKIATNTGYPSWGYMIEKGATTIWELWNGDTADPSMNSANHVMLLGDVIVWFFEYLAGIQNSPNNVGFKEIVMKPYPIDGLDYVTASYNSVHGKIKSEWKKENGTFVWNITVPCNTTAIVKIPSNDKSKVKESGKTASSSKGVKFLQMTDGYALYKVGSGNYSFTAF